MKKLFIGIAAIAVTTMLSGCGMTMFNAMNATGNQALVELADNNFRVIKEVKGHSSATYVFFIGGLSKRAARENAIADMFKSAKLTGSQTITNIYVQQHVTTVLGIYIRVSFAATGQVVEFLPKNGTTIDTTPTYNKPSTFSFTPKQEIEQAHHIGETYDDGVKKGIIFSLSGDGNHGKIVYTEIFPNILWCGNKDVSFVGTKDRLDGENNMKTIMGIKDWQTKYPAFAKCAELGDGWYLPSIEELRELKENIDFFQDSEELIWSSTEIGSKVVQVLNTTNVHRKTNALNVVAVAKF